MRPISANINDDGRLEIFLSSAIENRLWHTSQISPGGTWAPGERLPVTPVPIAGPAVSLCTGKTEDSRLELFTLGTDGKVYHIWQRVRNGGWSGWESLDGAFGAPATLAVERQKDGRLMLFALASDGPLRYIAQTSSGGAWGTWQSLGGDFASPRKMTVAVNADGRLEVFAIASDLTMRHAWQTSPSGSWSGWHSLGGVFPAGANLVAARNYDGRLELFAVGTDSSIWHCWQISRNERFTRWARLGGTFEPSAQLGYSVNQRGHLELFVFHAGVLRHIWQQEAGGAWNPWRTLEGFLPAEASLAVALNRDQRIEVFVLGHEELYHVWQHTPNGSWSDWEQLAPRTPYLDAVAGETHTDVSWSTPIATEEYELQEDTDGPSVWTRVYRGTASSWTGTGKTPQRYYYRVRSLNAIGPSAWSERISVVVEEPHQPPPPADQLPELIPTLTTEPLSVQANQPFTLVCVIANVGGSNAGSFMVRIAKDNFGPVLEERVDGIRAGGQHRIEWPQPGLRRGSHAYDAYADFYGEVTELEEGNNFTNRGLVIME